MFLQFELWKECPNNCTFCYNKGIVFKRNKLKSMQFIKEKLLSKETDSYDRIGFIMGEAFSGQLHTTKEHDLFYELIDILIEKIKKQKAKQILITASLIYSDLTNWIEFCNKLKDNNVEKDFLICTSYDTIGRFNEIKKEHWINTITTTQKLYPNIKFHIETIITEDFLQKVITNNFDIKNFENEYKCNIDYIVPFIGYSNLYKTKQEMQQIIPDFFPKRETLYKFLQYVYSNNIFTVEDLKKFISIDLHSDKVYFSLDDENVIEKIDRHTKENKRYYFDNIKGGYIDSDIHPREDVETFIKLIGG